MIRGIISPTNGAMVREISARWADIASVLTVGRTRPAATPRAGQTAPKSEPVNATGPREPAKPIESVYRAAHGVWCRAGPRSGSGFPAGRPWRSPGKPSPGRFSCPAHPGTRLRRVCLAQPAGSPPLPPRRSFFEGLLRERIGPGVLRARPAACDTPMSPDRCRPCAHAPRPRRSRQSGAPDRSAASAPPRRARGPARPRPKVASSAICAGARRRTRAPFQRFERPARPSAL